METQTLKSKWWYRLLKILYILTFIIALLVIINITYVRYHYDFRSSLPHTDWSSFYYYLVIRTIAAIFIFKMVKSFFFYIVTGKWNFINFKNKKEILNPFAGN